MPTATSSPCSATDKGPVAVVSRQHFNPSDLSVSAQMADIKASGAQVQGAIATATPIALPSHDFTALEVDRAVGGLVGREQLPIMAIPLDNGGSAPLNYVFMHRVEHTSRSSCKPYGPTMVLAKSGLQTVG